jgi:hypothetical protein
VHHATILEFPGPSVRADEAKRRATIIDDNTTEEKKPPTNRVDNADAFKTSESRRGGPPRCNVDAP